MTADLRNSRNIRGNVYLAAQCFGGAAPEGQGRVDMAAVESARSIFEERHLRRAAIQLDRMLGSWFRQHVRPQKPFERCFGSGPDASPWMHGGLPLGLLKVFMLEMMAFKVMLYVIVSACTQQGAQQGAHLGSDMFVQSDVMFRIRQQACVTAPYPRTQVQGQLRFCRRFVCLTSWSTAQGYHRDDDDIWLKEPAWPFWLNGPPGVEHSVDMPAMMKDVLHALKHLHELRGVFLSRSVYPPLCRFTTQQVRNKVRLISLSLAFTGRGALAACDVRHGESSAHAASLFTVLCHVSVSNGTIHDTELTLQ